MQSNNHARVKNERKTYKIANFSCVVVHYKKLQGSDLNFKRVTICNVSVQSDKELPQQSLQMLDPMKCDENFESNIFHHFSIT